MGQASSREELLRLQLSIWHEDCWTLQVTAEHPGSLLCRGTFSRPDGTVAGRFTVSGDSADTVRRLIAAARDCPLTNSVWELHPEFTMAQPVPPGTQTQEIFVEYASSNSIDSMLAAEGFLRDEPNIIADGRERWRVVTVAERSELQSRLDRVQDRMGADVTVEKIMGSKPSSDAESEAGRQLSVRQREIFEYARNNGYYTWPRETTLEDLAADHEISKNTLLEHLRKAEAKLLG